LAAVDLVLDSIYLLHLRATVVEVNVGIVKRERLYFLAAMGLVLVAVLSRLFFNGLVFRFDYGLYQPDGAHYTFRTLLFLGHSQNDAANLVVDWYKKFSVDTKSLRVSDLLPSTNPLWNLSVPRFIYPALSMIPVYLLGIPGMLVIPILSLLALILAIQVIAFRLNKSALGLFINFLLLTSPTLLRWMVSNCTDSLLTGLFALTILVYQSKIDTRTKNSLILVSIFLTSFTRFCLPIWLAFFVFDFLVTRGKWKLVVFSILAFLMSLPAILLQPNGASALLPERNGQSFFSKFLYLPVSFAKVGFIESAELVVLDRVLLLGVLLGFYFSWKNFKDSSSKLFIATAIAVWTIGALNGVMGVNFRYQLPLIPVLALVLLKNLPEISIPSFIKIPS